MAHRKVAKGLPSNYCQRKSGGCDQLDNSASLDVQTGLMQQEDAIVFATKIMRVARAFSNRPGALQIRSGP
jgi:hypothetical protein